MDNDTFNDSPEDIEYHIYVQQKIDAGIEAAERGEFIADEEIEGRIEGVVYGGRNPE